ncbi:MAG: flippase [Acidobacteria bacterium]|nr:flippase [Acidobacteriota bacterium]
MQSIIPIEEKSTPPFSVAKLLRGSGSRVINLLLSTLIGFFLTPYIVRSLGAEQYGIWALAYAFIGYYSLLDLGMSAAVFTHISFAFGQKDDADASRIYSTGLAVFGISGIILAVVTVVIAACVGHFAHQHAMMIAWVILIVGLLSASNFPMRVFFGTLNAGAHFDITSGLLIAGTLLRAIGTVVALRLHYGVIALALVNVLAGIPINILAIYGVKRKYAFLKVLRPKYERHTGRKLMRFGFPVIFGQLADRVRFQTDSLTVSYFIGIIALAHYNIATTLVMYYMDGILAIIGVLAPVLTVQQSRKDEAGLRQSILVGTRLGLCSSGFVLFGIIAWGHAFIGRWMGANYLDAYPVLVILSIAVFLDVSQATSVSALYATMNQQYYAVVNVVEAALNLVLSIILAPHYGAMGVAYGTLIPSIVVRLIVQPILVQRRLGLSVRTYWAATLPTAFRTAAFLVIPALVTRWLLRPTYPTIFLTAALSAILFALPMWYYEFNMRGAVELTARWRMLLVSAGLRNPS